MQKIDYNSMVTSTFSISIEEKLKKKLDKAIAKGRLGANRSQAIAYCIKQVLQLDTGETKGIELLIDFIELIKKRPEVEKQLREFYEDPLNTEDA